MKIWIYIFFVLVGSYGNAQLTTSVNQSPAGLVQNVLLGSGVTVSNITYNGHPTAIGSFTASNSNLGLNSGVIITTGTVINNGNGPHGPNNKGDAGVNNGAPGSALLAGQLGGGAQTFNAATLEFDFIPYSDTVRFRYVFASEEYPEYVGTAFNDIFGFFISGPGISGNQNIARIPGSGAVVAINNVNNGNPNGTAGPSNSQYFVTNPNGGTIQYDGFTKVLEAVSKVECGKTYHLIIAIADVGDGEWDSGIFLEANSLNSKTPVNVNYNLSYTAFNDPSVLAEGCVSAAINVSRTQNLNTSMTIPISVSGTATQGTDYTTIPTSITLAPGQASAQFTFSALQDNVTEGLETLEINFQLTDPCGNVKPLILKMGIDDLQPVDLVMNDTIVLCSGDEVRIIPHPSGGVGPYTFNWSTGDSGSTITVFPTVTTTYTLTVTDNCLLESATEDITVTVPVYQPLVLTTSGDESVQCPFIRDTLWASATGGTGIYTYSWFLTNGLKVGFKDSLFILPSQTTNYQVIAIDQCGNSDTVDIVYTILSSPMTLQMSPPLEICPADSVDISVTPSGGFGNYYYDWTHSNETTAQVTVAPFFTTTYTVIASDDCQTFTVVDSVKVTVVRPKADFQISSNTVYENLPITFQNLTINGVSYVWTFGDGNGSSAIHPNNTYQVPGYYDITLIATDAKGCRDTVVRGIQILEEVYVYVPNSFTPDGDRYNNTFQVSSIGVKEMSIQIFNRWGEILFESNDPRFYWDGFGKNGKLVKEGVYTYILKYTTRRDVTIVKEGHIVLLK